MINDKVVSTLFIIALFLILYFKFRMLEVISSYQEFFASKASKLERTGFLPVELTDKCSTAEVMSDNYTSQWLVNFGGRRPLTPFNSQQAELAKVK
jgi:hypothetical protein